MEHGERGDRPTQIERDIEAIACQMVEWREDLIHRLEGVKTDSEVALLQQVAKLDRRFKKLEALVAERVAPDLAAELLASIDLTT